MEGEASKPFLSSIQFGKPASVFQASWRGLEAGDPSGRVPAHLNVRGAVRGEVSIEIEGASAVQALALVRC
jgi:hypothetical protein